MLKSSEFCRLFLYSCIICRCSVLVLELCDFLDVMNEKRRCRYNIYERDFLLIKADGNCTYGITCFGLVCVSVLGSRLIGVGEMCVFRSGACVSELNIIGCFKLRVVFPTVLFGCQCVVLVLSDIKLF
jgi:hypothetical protein